MSDTYESIQKDLLAQIHGLELRLKELDATTLETPDVKDKLRSALDVVDKIIAGGRLDRRDIELLIERIDVDADGLPEIWPVRSYQLQSCRRDEPPGKYDDRCGYEAHYGGRTGLHLRQVSV